MDPEKQLMHQYLSTFERIANALERIAHVLETAPPAPAKPGRAREESTDAAPASETDEQVLVRMLAQRELTLAEVPPLSPMPKLEQDLLRFTGERYARTQKLVQRVASWPDAIPEFYMHLKGEEQPAINDMVHVARHALNLGLFKEMTYKGGPHFMLNAVLPPEPAARAYFKLGWILGFMTVDARRIFESIKKTNRVISVPRLSVMADGNRLELVEPLVILNGRELFWLGAGLTGPTGGGLDELKTIRERLKLDSRNAWRVALTDEEAQQVDAALQAGFTLVTLEQFSARFQAQVSGKSR